MKIEKINIDGISDDKKFLDVALLVDQPHFLDLVVKARGVWEKELGINLPMTYENYSEFVRSLYEKPEVQECIKERIEKSLRWLHISVAYTNVVKSAILSSEVRSADFRPVLLSSEIGVRPDKLDLRYTHFLIFTPNARKTDVDKAFFRYQAGFKKEVSKADTLRYNEFDDQYPNLSEDELEEQRVQLAGYAYLATLGLNSRAKTELRKYRKWYWLDLEVRAKYGQYKSGVLSKVKKLPWGVYKTEVIDKITYDKDINFRALSADPADEIDKGITFYTELLGKSKTR